MKKLLLTGLTLGLLLPTLAFAAYNDVSLGTSAIFTVADQSVSVAGSSDVVESVSVGAESLSFVLLAGSTVKLSSSGFKQIDSNAAAQYITGNTCESNSSTMTFASSADTVAVTVYLKSIPCPRSGGSSHSSGGSSSGGGSSATHTVSVPAVVAQTPAVSVTAGNPSRVTLTANLTRGSKGASVKSLQQFLNTHGFSIAASGPGSPGNETDSLGGLTVQAIQKFQVKYGIAGPGLPGYGSVGPKTRAKVNELSQ